MPRKAGGKKRKSQVLSIPDDAYWKLLAISTIEHRSMSGQMTHLIENEYAFDAGYQKTVDEMIKKLKKGAE